MHIVYASNGLSGDISVLHLDSDTGQIEQVQSMAVGGRMGALAVSPDHRFLYAARRSEPWAAAAFGINPRDGRLSPLGETALPASMAYLAVDHGGRFLLSASYAHSLLTVNPIEANGRLGAVQQTVPTPPKAHAVVPTPTNRQVMATSLGGDVVLQLDFDAASGHLALQGAGPVRVRPGAGPRHLVFHPHQEVAYLLNELDATLDVFPFHAAEGRLGERVQTQSFMPANVSGDPWGADLHLTPDGLFLYASERRSSTLSAFHVDARDGRLSLIEQVPTEAQPRAFHISPDGRCLVSAGQLSHHLSVHAIDEHSGRLTLLNRVAVGQDPNWVEVIQPPAMLG